MILPVWKRLALTTCLALLAALQISGCSVEDSPETQSLSNLHMLQASDEMIEVEGAPPRPSIYFSLGDAIWIVDYNNQMWKSLDLGNSWDVFPHPVKEKIVSILIDDSGKTALLTDYKGQLHRSNDSGESWVTINVVQQLIEESVREDHSSELHFLLGNSADHLYLNHKCELFYSADQGSVWSRISPAAISNKNDLCVELVNKNDRNIVTQAVVSKSGNSWDDTNYLFSTENGGISWKQLCSTRDYSECPDSEKLPYKFLHYPSDRTSTHRTDQIEPLIDSALRAIRESKGIPGMNPAMLDMLISEDVVVRSKARLWYHGADSRLSYSDDNGQNWSNIFSPAPFANQNYYSNHSTGLLTGGSIYLKDSFDKIKKTADGKNWINAETPDGVPLSGLFVKNDQAIATANAEIIIKVAGEASWAPIHTFKGSIQDAMLETDNWWVTTDDPGGSVIHRSTDRGATWESGSPVYYYQLQCTINYCVLSDENTLTIVSATEDESLKVTQYPFSRVDGQCLSKESPAESYNSNGNIESFFWSEEQNAIWVVSQGALCKSSDMGASWESVFDYFRTHTQFHNSPQGQAAMLLQSRIIDGNEHIVPLVFSSNKWNFPGAIPGTSIGYYFSEEEPVCWMDEEKAVLRVFSKEEEELYYATDDAGLNWSAFHLNSDWNGFCVRWQDHLQIGDSFVWFK